MYFMFCPHVCIWIMCVPGAHRGHESIGILDLKLPMAETLWVLGGKNQVLLSALNQGAISPSLNFCSFKVMCIYSKVTSHFLYNQG